MRKRIAILTLILTFVFLTVSSIALGADSDVAANVEKWGPLTLTPPLVAITLAFITKNVVLSLFIGVFTGAFLINMQGANVLMAFIGAFKSLIEYVLYSLADPWDAGIVLQVLTIGGVIALVSKMGGAKAVAEALAKRAKTARSAQLITWVLGLFVFFDDYANSLIVGPIMRPVTDKYKISREKLSFIIDATAAPIAGIALISTWVGYELSLIKKAYVAIGQDVNAYSVFIQTIPFRFYNILILAFIVFSALLLKDFGPMAKAQKRAYTTGKLIADNSNPMTSEEATELEPDAGTKLNMWNAIVPIGVLLVTAFIGFYTNGHSIIMAGEDQALKDLLTATPFSLVAIREAFGASDASVVLFQAALLASIVALIMGAWQKIFTFKEGIDIWVRGIKSLVITGVILLLAWSLSSVIKDLGTADYLVLALSDAIPAFILPSIIFVLGAIISFATGTSYGTMGILMPLAIPLAYAINPLDSGYIIMSAGAVLTGAIFGDHCSPISDTTILSSMGAAVDHLDHIRTQMPYALIVAAITIVFGYIPVGLGLPVGIVLPIAIVATGVVLHFVGHRVDTEECDKELEGAEFSKSV